MSGEETRAADVNSGGGGNLRFSCSSASIASVMASPSALRARQASASRWSLPGSPAQNATDHSCRTGVLGYHRSDGMRRALLPILAAAALAATAVAAPAAKAPTRKARARAVAFVVQVVRPSGAAVTLGAQRTRGGSAAAGGAFAYPGDG